MRSRVLILASLVAFAAVIFIIGVAVAGADQSTPLPEVSAPDLLAQMAQANGGVSAISGDISWHNGLFGDLSAASSMAHLPAQSPLTGSGSGRIWVSDAGARVESQGTGGDQVVVLSKKDRTAWVYDYTQNTAKKFVMTGQAPAETPSPAPSATFMTPEMITLYLTQFARYATVDVAGQASVAGQDTYLLRMTPVATDSALGYVQAAVDGKTMVPLRLEVYARGGTSPVLSFGFDKVSYDAIDASLFTFSPPAGAKVTTKTVDGAALRAKAENMQKAQAPKAEPSEAQKAAAKKQVHRALLTRAQVQNLVPYELAWARGYEARPFDWGYVLDQGGPLTATGTPLMKVLGAAAGMDAGPPVLGGADSYAPAGAQTAASDPSSVLLYGSGFGSIALAQTQTTPALEKQLKQLQQASPLFEKAAVDGAQAQVIGTPLGGVVIWQKGDTTLVAGGMVPMSDLTAFASSVR